LISFDPEVGLEPTTNRLTEERQSKDFEELQAFGQVLGRFTNGAAEIAAELLRRVADGGAIERELMIGLAGAVVSDQRVALALEVLAGGAHVLDRALQLAAIVLEARPAHASTIGRANEPR
jgi:hypothetical protein